MLYPRLTYGADKRYLRRKSLIKIYRREIRGERVSKGDVNEPALPPPFLLFVERRTWIRRRGGGRGDNRRREDRGDRSFVNFIDLCWVEFFSVFFMRERLMEELYCACRGEKGLLRLFIYFFLIFEKFIERGLFMYDNDDTEWHIFKRSILETCINFNRYY